MFMGALTDDQMVELLVFALRRSTKVAMSTFAARTRAAAIVSLLRSQDLTFALSDNADAASADEKASRESPERPYLDAPFW